MKRHIFSTLFAIVGLLCSVNVYAHDFVVDGIYYSILNSTNKTVEVTYQGSSYNSYFNEYPNSVVIPESVVYNGVTYIVSAIDKDTFRDCPGLTSVTIPASVTSIGEYAFSGCAGLTSITIPNSVTSIGEGTFSGCTGLTTITIGNSVTSIGYVAFRDCTGLTEITIPNSVTSIDDYAFRVCTGLTEITIPNSVTSIGEHAFLGCSGLSSIVVEEGNNVYDSRESCNAIIKTATNTLIVGCKNSVIPESVTAIGENAFYGCTGLTSITIPNSVTSIGEGTFFGCTGLTEVTIPNSVTSIGSSAFSGCTGLTEVTIPNSVTSIGSSAFYGCTGLTEITIPNSVTSIGSYAFSGCTGLTEVTIPNSVTSIGKYAFNRCSNLLSLTLGSKLSSIDERAFYQCSNLNVIHAKGNVPPALYDRYVFYQVNKSIPVYVPTGCVEAYKKAFGWSEFSLILEENTEPLPDGAPLYVDNVYYLVKSSADRTLEVTFKGDSYFSYVGEYYGEIVIPDSVTFHGVTYAVTEIRESAFQGCTGLTSVTIGNSVTSIGDFAFYGCTGLTSITIGNSVTSIGYNAFYDCTGLTSITIGNSVTSIGYEAFSHCTGLTDITIPNSVTSIGNYAFSECTALKSLTIEDGDSELELGYNGSKEGLFYDCPIEILYIGRNLSYNTSYSSGYSPFYNKKELKTVTIGNSVTSIGYNAFYDCDGLTSVTIGSGVTSIGQSAFSSCSGLTSITIPSSVTSIGQSAFSSCSGLTSITIPNSVTLIGESAFYGCTGLTEITIPNSVTSIGKYAFYGCDGLTSITIPDKVTSIGQEAFSGCTGLTSVTIGSGVTSIDYEAFYSCINLMDVTIGGNVISIGNNSFYGCTKLKKLTLQDGEATLDLGYSGNYKNGLFYYCPIDTLYIGRNLSYQYAPFADIEELKSVTIGDSVTAIGDAAFSGCTGLTEVTIPNSVTLIGESAFLGCTGLTSITIPNSVTSIGSVAFYGCVGLTSVVIPACVTAIGDAAFSHCTGLTSVTIGNSVTSIGGEAFYGCDGLTSITIPDKVTSIGYHAFYDCANLTEIHVKATTPPALYDNNVFYNVSKSIPVYVPEGCAEAYRKAGYWSEFTNIIGLPDGAFVVNDIYYIITSEENKTVGVTFKGSTCDEHANEYTGEVVIPASVVYGDVTYRVTAIGKETFRGCTALTSVTIPASVTSIGEHAFLGCSGLASIVVEEGNNVYDSRESCNAIVETATNTLIAGCKNSVIPGSVTKIGAHAFEGCSAMESITIPDGVTTIGFMSFSYCTDLTQITISKSVTTIEDSAFYGCSALASITIPKGVTTIGEGAFSGCTGLAEIHIEATTPPTIYSTTFNSVSRTIPVHVPLHCADVYSNAEYWSEFTNIIAPAPLAVVTTTPAEGAEVESFSEIVVEFNKPVYCANETGAAVKDAEGSTVATLVVEMLDAEGATADGSPLATQVRLYTAEPIYVEGAYSVNIPADMFATDGNEEYSANTVVNVTVKLPVLPVGTAIEADGIYYKVTSSDDRTVEVTFKGSAYGAYTNEYTGEVVIPASVVDNYVTYRVTAIGDEAFRDCIGLKTVILPESVATIGEGAFWYCTGLTSVTISERVTSIGKNAFLGCSGLVSIVVEEGNKVYDSRESCNAIVETATNTLIVGCKNSVIPESVTAIGENAFWDCTGLASVTIPNSVTSIGNNAFYGCTRLTSVTIGNGVTSIGQGAFCGCDGLTSITIPDKVTSIGQDTFYSCDGLTSVTIGSGVTEIGNNAFYSCDGLTSITIPNSVTSIGNNAFYNCTGLTSVTIGNSVTAIGKETFRGCTGLTSITIPDKVTSIGSYAFGYCANLAEIHVKATTPPVLYDNNVFYNVSKSIPVYVPVGSAEAYRKASYWKSFTNFIESRDGVFVYDGIYYKITDEANKTVEVTYKGGKYDSYIEYSGAVVIPESVVYDDVTYSVTAIGDEAFRGCTALTSVTIPASVTSIGESAFSSCTGLSEIAIPGSVTNISTKAFYSCIKLTSVVIPAGVTTIGTTPFAYCTAMSTITVEEGNKVYDSRESCNAIVETATNTLIVGCKNCVIPGSVTKIGAHAFEGCSAMESITIPDGVTTIGFMSFSYCTDLTQITISKSVTIIEDSAFYGCSALASITIPKGVTSIGNYAFYDCTGLADIYVRATTPPAIYSSTFGNVSTSIPVYVPVGCVEAYGHAEGWSEFGNIKEVEINFVSDNIHYKVTSQKDNTVEVTYKGSTYEEYTDEYSGEVVIPASVVYGDVTYRVTAIGKETFRSCTALTSIVIPASVTSIGEHAFLGCSGLSSIVVEEGNNVYDSRESCNAIIKTATNALIAGCNNTVIPGSVTAIGKNAFNGCTGLKNVTIPESVAVIGNGAFYGCTGLTEMHIEATAPPKIEDSSAFYNVDKSIPVYVPEGCAEAYRKAGYWSEFTNIIGLPDGAFVVNDIYYMITSEDNKTVGVTFKGSTCDEHANEYTGEVVIPASVVYGGVTYRVTAIGKETFRSCTALTSIVIPASVTSMGEGVFYNCYGLTSVTIPASVTAIGEYAFSGCAGLASIVVEEGNNVYDSRESCNAIIEVSTNRLIVGCKNTVIPEGVVAIGKNAFYRCADLASVTIPKGVTSIGEGAFSYCTGLTEIHIEATTPPTIYSTTFNSVSRTIPVHVPLHCADVYSNAEYWSEFTNIIAPAPLAVVKTTPAEGAEVESFSEIVVEFNKPVYCANETGAAVKDAEGSTVATLVAEMLDAEGTTADGSPLATQVRLYTTEPIYVEGAYSVNIPVDMFATDGNEEYSANTVVNVTVKLPVLPVGTAIEADGIYYKVTSSDDRTVEVTFKGGYYGEYANEYTGEVVIPASVVHNYVTYRVTAIGNYAFAGCPGLTSVTIPEGVTLIGQSAYYGCTGLTSVTIPEGVTSIGFFAFSHCTGLTAVTISDGVISIGGDAFYGCTSLTSVVIPGSVTTIGTNLFAHCTALSTITVEEGNKVYDSRESCNAIVETATNTLIVGCKNSVIPEGVTTIGEGAFRGCSGLATITIPGSVATIGNYTFYDCTGLTKIHVNATTPPTIGSATFTNVNRSIPVYVPAGCTSFYRSALQWNAFVNIIEVEILVDGIYYKVTSGENRTVEVTYKGTTYYEHADEYTGEVVIPESVVYGDITYSVAAIGKLAFKGCTGLTSVVIPGSVTAIGGAAFEECTALAGVTIDSGVTEIGDYAFYNCTALTSVTLPEGVATIGTSAFQACSCVASVVIPGSVTEIGEQAFSYCYGLTSVTISDGVAAIGKSAFKGCTGLTSVVIPGSVTAIGGAAFEECTALANVTIDSGVTEIGDYAFYNCTALTSVTLPEGVATIGNSAFRGCFALTLVDIPSSTTSIGDYAFSYCRGLTQMRVHATTPPTVKSNTFFQVDKSIPLYVPVGSSGSYRNTSYWNHFTNIIEIGENVFVAEGICYKIIDEENETVEVTYKGSTYDEYADEYTGEVVIPESVMYRGITYRVTAIGTSAFKGCTGLTSAVIPASVTAIGGAAFEGCTALANVTIDSGVTEIGNFAFYNCKALTSVTLPESVATIGTSAFQACTGLTQIIVQATTPPEIQGNTFLSVDKYTLVYVPVGCVETYSKAYGWKDFAYILEIGTEPGISLAAESIKVRKENNEWQPQEVSLPISMQNTVPVVGMQCDIELPEGLTAVKQNDRYAVSLSTRAEGYRMETISLQDGRLRVLIYPQTPTPIVIYGEDLYIIKSGNSEQSATSRAATSHGQEKALSYPQPPTPISGSEGPLFTIKLKPNEQYSTTEHVSISHAVVITRDYTMQTIADLMIACTLQDGNTAGESDISDLADVESTIRIYATGNRVMVESPEAQEARIIMPNGLVLSEHLQAGHNEIPLQQGLYIVVVGREVRKVMVR